MLQVSPQQKKKRMLAGTFSWLFSFRPTFTFTLYSLNSFYIKVPSMRREELLLYHQGERPFIQYPNVVLMQHYVSFVS